MDKERYAKRNQRMVEQYKSGISTVELSKIYGISQQRVSSILYNLGAGAKTIKDNEKLVDTKEKLKATKKEYADKIRKLRAEMMSLRLDILNLKNKVAYKDKKIAKLENKLEEIRGITK